MRKLASKLPLPKPLPKSLSSMKLRQTRNQNTITKIGHFEAEGLEEPESTKSSPPSSTFSAPNERCNQRRHFDILNYSSYRPSKST
ncbi:hypothetical protein EYC84_009163 [Monilinia fructicola]|uniref:Uncharacterized protein n=1 Tax=Monilinia fructicola TaxID=38448 RepID=A0A5M9JFA5_MONFR|nr:hypothetical protein EYC84_009163 [Monilinia fructicola]